MSKFKKRTINSQKDKQFINLDILLSNLLELGSKYYEIFFINSLWNKRVCVQ